jgi:hypothetical protein
VHQQALQEVDLTSNCPTHHLLLQIGRLSIKDIHRLHPMLNHPQRPIKESHEMTGRLSTLIHQLLSIPLSDCNEELVETHRGVDCDFAAEEGLDVVVLDRIGRFIGDE